MSVHPRKQANDSASRWPAQPRVLTCLSAEAPELAESYARAHFQALSQYGVELEGAGQMPADPVRLLLAVDGKDVVGGLQLHDARLGPLPLERVVGPVLRPEQRAGAAEVAGVFVASSRRKGNLSQTLISTVITLSPMLGLNLLVLFSHQFSAGLYGAFGWVAAGQFRPITYPRPPYVSEVMILLLQGMYSGDGVGCRPVRTDRAGAALLGALQQEH